MPSQDFRFITDALARLGVNPPVGFNPGQMSTNTAGALNDLVNNPSGSARLDRAKAQRLINRDFISSSTQGRSLTAPTIGTSTPRSPVPGIAGQPGIVNRLGQGFRRLQSIGPTALNPLATRTPTTNLGRLGSFLNPLNPTTAAGIGISLIPGLADKDRAGLQTGLFMPGGPLLKTLSAIAVHDFNNPVGLTDKREAELIEQSKRIAGIGPNRHLKNAEGKYWAGKNWGYQSPESFNALFNADLPIPRPDTPDVVDSIASLGSVVDPIASLNNQAPVVINIPETPGQAMGNMAGNDLYNQARQAALEQGTQQDREMVTNLGLAQWRANFPGLAGSPLSPEALQKEAQQKELEIKSQDFMKKYRRLMEANKK